jgi:pyridoxine kinase
MPVNQTPTTPTLYQREGAYIPRVAAVHDLCGYGKCSLGVAIPVLSAAGCDVCPVPTGLFSSHTAFPGWYMHDTTNILHDYLEAWKGIDVDIDAVYSGFLGAPEQVDIIRDIYETYPKALKVVDPVMADHGKVYPTYTPELCQAMADLACDADILTPNLTEASIILGTEWHGTDISDVFEVHNEFVPYLLHGTGDLYASCLLAGIMAGRTLYEAAWFAGNLTHDAIEVSTKQPHFQERGVNFEPLLGKVAALLG